MTILSLRKLQLFMSFLLLSFSQFSHSYGTGEWQELFSYKLSSFSAQGFADACAGSLPSRPWASAYKVVTDAVNRRCFMYANDSDGPCQEGETWNTETNSCDGAPPDCPEPEVWNEVAQACEDPCKDKEGQTRFVFFPNSTSVLSSVCMSSCSANLYFHQQLAAGGVQANYEYTGSSCTGSPDGGGDGGDEPIPPPPDAEPIDPQPVKPKESSASDETKSDGSKVETESKTEEKIKPDGKVEATKITVKKTTNVDGSTSEETTTETTETNPDGTEKKKKGIVVVHKDFEGNVTGIDASDSESEGDSSSAASGGKTCDSPPVCTGDPIQCEILRQTYETRCAVTHDLAKELTDLKGSNTSPLLNENGSLEELASTDEEVSDLVDMGFITSPSDPLGGSTCPAPYSVGIRGKSISLSFQPLCDLASGLRPLVILMGMFSSLFIMYRGLER